MSAGLFESCTLLGVAAIAVWAYARLPRLRPRTISVAIGHVIVSFLIFYVVPFVVSAIVAAFSAPFSVIVAVAAVTVPSLSYVFLSWIWLLARLDDRMRSTPRGGHPLPVPGAGPW